jgi:hypothetical protein
MAQRSKKECWPLLSNSCNLAPPNRSADWRDILWATLGALTATLLLKLLRC